MTTTAKTKTKQMISRTILPNMVMSVGFIVAVAALHSRSEWDNYLAIACLGVFLAVVSVTAKVLLSNYKLTDKITDMFALACVGIFGQVFAISVLTATASRTLAVFLLFGVATLLSIFGILGAVIVKNRQVEPKRKIRDHVAEKTSEFQFWMGLNLMTLGALFYNTVDKANILLCMGGMFVVSSLLLRIIGESKKPQSDRVESSLSCALVPLTGAFILLILTLFGILLGMNPLKVLIMAATCLFLSLIFGIELLVVKVKEYKQSQRNELYNTFLGAHRSSSNQATEKNNAEDAAKSLANERAAHQVPAPAPLLDSDDDDQLETDITAYGSPIFASLFEEKERLVRSRTGLARLTPKNAHVVAKNLGYVVDYSGTEPVLVTPGKRRYVARVGDWVTSDGKFQKGNKNWEPGGTYSKVEDKQDSLGSDASTDTTEESS